MLVRLARHETPGSVSPSRWSHFERLLAWLETHAEALRSEARGPSDAER